MARRDEDEDQDENQGDEWVIGTWHVFYHVELLAVPKKDGKPRPDYGPASTPLDWYTWSSYHAARKYQWSHQELAGYIICNLSAMRRQSERRKRLKAERG